MKGVYVLTFKVNKKILVGIGSLGKLAFDRGTYAYVGSAQNNLEKRVSRHLSKTKKKFWHIDYLLDNKFAKILNVFYKKSRKSEECRIAKKLSKIGISIPKFGCSDCNCKSHLLKIDDPKIISKLGIKKVLKC